MPRPLKCRRVGQEPQVQYFKPRGIPLHLLEEVQLTVDELEAIRLADLEGLYQEQAAKKMGISRQTFGNILISAHGKIAQSIVLGKAIKIEGGIYAMDEKRAFRCSECRHKWSVGRGLEGPGRCPQCQSPQVHRAPLNRGQGQCAGRRGRRMYQRGAI